MAERSYAILTTFALGGRDEGTGEVVSEVIVSEMSVSGGTTSSTSVGNHSPRSRGSTNDRRN